MPSIEVVRKPLGRESKFSGSPIQITDGEVAIGIVEEIFYGLLRHKNCRTRLSRNLLGFAKDRLQLGTLLVEPVEEQWGWAEG